jgi:hypothetical protein
MASISPTDRAQKQYENTRSPEMKAILEKKKDR